MMLFEVTETTQHIDKYNDCSEAHWKQIFRVGRQWPWQKWQLLTAYGVGFEPGMVFNAYKIQAGSYRVRLGDRLINVNCERLLQHELEEFPYFHWISGEPPNFISQNIVSIEEWRQILPDILARHSSETIKNARCSLKSTTTFGLDHPEFSGSITLREHLSEKGFDVFSAAVLSE